MFQFDNIEPARFLIRLMKLCGLWNFTGKPWNKYYHIYSFIMHSTFTFPFTLATYINVAVSKNMDELSEALFISLTETALVIKVINTLRNSCVVINLLNTFENNVEGLPRNSLERGIMSQAHAGFRRFRNFFAISTFFDLAIPSTVTLIASFLNKGFELSFPCWIPFDYRKKENYYYAYVFVFGGMAVTAASNVAVDLYQSYLLVQLSAYYKLLGFRLENIVYENEPEILNEELKKLFEFHAFLVKLTGRCERLISLPLMVQILMSASILCVSIYKLQNTSFLDDPSTFLKYLIYSIIMLLQIYIPCNYGNDLSESAYTLTNCVYNSNWIDFPLEKQKEIFTYMELLKQPLVLRAGNFFVIGLGTFTQTMKNAYSLYALLLNIEM